MKGTSHEILLLTLLLSVMSAWSLQTAHQQSLTEVDDHRQDRRDVSAKNDKAETNPDEEDRGDADGTPMDGKPVRSDTPLFSRISRHANKSYYALQGFI